MADSSFEAEFLQTHNKYRDQHGAPPLTMSRSLCQSAQAWAQHLLSIKTLQHSKENYGENLFYSFSSVPKKPTGCEAVDSWYSEIKDYHFDRPGFTSGTGHFTQVVWKDTRELGVGLATDGTTIFVVGQYLPAGNISNAGYYEKNVLPPGSKADATLTPTCSACETGTAGEDTGSTQPQKLTGREAVDSLFNEIKDYHFNRLGFSSGTGHFTQVVWKDTRELGVGLATDGTTTFVVDQYLPAGNISNAGNYEKNVLPPGSKADATLTPSRPACETETAGEDTESTQPQKLTESTSNMADRSFEAEFLQTHNKYRDQHGAPPLTMSRSLCQSAQAWAQHLLSIKTLQHSKENYGENLFYSYSSVPKKPTGCEAVDSWYSEIKDYHFDRPGFTSGTGHFTQVVWKDTRELGVGLATDGTTIFVVGQYLPAGNISNAGNYEKNVLPPGSKADATLTPTCTSTCLEN